jgi:hypothetical protein
MSREAMDAHPIKSLVAWLDWEAQSISQIEMAEKRDTDLVDLKRRIDAGQYQLDARAIAEAIFGRADRTLGAFHGSEMLKAAQGNRPAGTVDQL